MKDGMVVEEEKGPKVFPITIQQHETPDNTIRQSYPTTSLYHPSQPRGIGSQAPYSGVGRRTMTPPLALPTRDTRTI